MASSEWRMGTPNGLFGIRYWKGRRDETHRAPAMPSADRPRCPIAPCRASKGLKMLKTTRASYWLELASIWDRRHVRLGSAPPRLRRRYARNDGKRPWKWEQSEPVAPRQVASLVFGRRLNEMLPEKANLCYGCWRASAPDESL